MHLKFFTSFSETIEYGQFHRKVHQAKKLKVVIFRLKKKNECEKKSVRHSISSKDANKP